jgi:hypothetical protein
MAFGCGTTCVASSVLFDGSENRLIPIARFSLALVIGIIARETTCPTIKAHEKRDASHHYFIVPFTI